MAFRIKAINIKQLLTARLAAQVCSLPRVQRNIALISSFQPLETRNSSLLSSRFQVEHIQNRYKKRSKGGPGKKATDDDEEGGSDDDDDEEGEGEDLEVVGKGYFDSTVNVNSTVNSKVSRTKIEEAFYDSRIRINNGRVTKKSVEVAEDDVLDIILGRNSENNDMIDVSRIEIKEIPEKQTSRQRLLVKIRKYAPMTIENYEDPYDGTLLHQKKS